MSANGAKRKTAVGPLQSLLVAKIGREIVTFASEFRDEDFSESLIRVLLSRNSGFLRQSLNY
jgi:hypothetical protein